MTWFVIIFLFLLTFVPLLYAIPSPRQRKQARMRKRATEAGLGVEIQFIPKLSAESAELVSVGGKLREPKIECAAYQIRLRKPVDIPRLLLLKLPLNSKSITYEVFEYWGVRGEEEYKYLSRAPSLVQLIQSLEVRMPEDVLGLELTSQRLGLLWREGDDSEATIKNIEEVLSELREFVVNHKSDLTFE